MAHKSAEARSKSDPKEGAKPKLVRDSFTMPKADYALIEALKIRALEAKRPAKKSELLRAGLQALAALPVEKLVKALDALIPLKAGRPRKLDGVADAALTPAAVQATPPAPSAPKATQAVKVAGKSAAPKESAPAKARSKSKAEAGARPVARPRPAVKSPTRQRGPAKPLR